MHRKRQSIEPTYDQSDTGPRFHVTTWVGDRCVGFQQRTADPFGMTRVRVGWRDLLRGLRKRHLVVAVCVGGDASVVEDVMELDANYLGSNCTRRDEFQVSIGASLAAFAAVDPDGDSGSSEVQT